MADWSAPLPTAAEWQLMAPDQYHCPWAIAPFTKGRHTAPVPGSLLEEQPWTYLDIFDVWQSGTESSWLLPLDPRRSMIVPNGRAPVFLVPQTREFQRERKHVLSLYYIKCRLDDMVSSIQLRRPTDAFPGYYHLFWSQHMKGLAEAILRWSHQSRPRCIPGSNMPTFEACVETYLWLVDTGIALDFAENGFALHSIVWDPVTTTRPKFVEAVAELFGCAKDTQPIEAFTQELWLASQPHARVGHTREWRLTPDLSRSLDRAAYSKQFVTISETICQAVDGQDAGEGLRPTNRKRLASREIAPSVVFRKHNNVQPKRLREQQESRRQNEGFRTLSADELLDPAWLAGHILGNAHAGPSAPWPPNIGAGTFAPQPQQPPAIVELERTIGTMPVESPFFWMPDNAIYGDVGPSPSSPTVAGLPDATFVTRMLQRADEARAATAASQRRRTASSSHVDSPADDAPAVDIVAGDVILGPLGRTPPPAPRLAPRTIDPRQLVRLQLEAMDAALAAAQARRAARAANTAATLPLTTDADADTGNGSLRTDPDPVPGSDIYRAYYMGAIGQNSSLSEHGSPDRRQDPVRARAREREGQENRAPGAPPAQYPLDDDKGHDE